LLSRLENLRLLLHFFLQGLDLRHIFAGMRHRQSLVPAMITAADGKIAQT
jgi:hypothetical protein